MPGQRTPKGSTVDKSGKVHPPKQEPVVKTISWRKRSA
jgi:hypothetical protein